MSIYRDYDPKVIYEDNNFYGIYKPPYWQVTIGSNCPKSICGVDENMNRKLLQVWMYKNLDYPNKNNYNYDYGISNRLDINTSGVVLIGKTPSAYKHLRKVISDHRNTQKRYFALVRNKITKGGIIENKIKCLRMKRSARCENNGQGQYAKTYYEPITYFKDKNENIYTLLNIRIVTGRTHQIRVHMKVLDTEIVGDPFYVKNNEIYNYEKNLVPRIFLHAYNYNFPDMNGNIIHVYSPLSNDLFRSLKNNFVMVDDQLQFEEVEKFLSNPKTIVS